MPLVVLSGRPCTGKTSFANQLASFLRTVAPKDAAVTILNDESLGISKLDGYKNATTEKISRGRLKGAVERACNGRDTVIIDALNYIKGFRYELYCIVRQAGSTHCVVMLDAPHDSAKAWNDARGSAGYDPAIVDDLWTRYETPDEKNRWDAPLFHVNDSDVSDLLEAAAASAASPSAVAASSAASASEASASSSAAGASSAPASDAGASATAGAEGASAATEVSASPAHGGAGSGAAVPPSADAVSAPAAGAAAASSSSAAPTAAATATAPFLPVFPAIADALYGRAGLRPVTSTIVTTAAPPTYLTELDRVTSAIVAHLSGMLALAVPGDALKVPGCAAPVVLARRLPVVELRRLKRVFDKQATSAPVPLDAIGRHFVEFLNATLRG